jgi:hypothetical protein
MDGTYLFAFCSYGSVFVPLVLSLARYRELTKELRYLTYIIFVSVGCDTISLVLGMNRINSMPFTNLYLLLQFHFLVAIFRLHYGPTRVLNLTYVCAIASFLISAVFFDGLWKLSSIFVASSSLVLMTLSLIYFYLLLTRLPTLHIHRTPMLWVSFAVLFYYSGNFFQFLITNYIQGDANTARILWILHNLLNILKNILFTIAIWQSYRRTSSSLS